MYNVVQIIDFVSGFFCGVDFEYTFYIYRFGHSKPNGPVAGTKRVHRSHALSEFRLLSLSSSCSSNGYVFEIKPFLPVWRNVCVFAVNIKCKVNRHHDVARFGLLYVFNFMLVKCSSAHGMLRALCFFGCFLCGQTI